MKKEYSKQLKKIFKETLVRKIHGASLFSEKSKYIFPGEIVFFLGGLGSSKSFVILIPNSKDDEFTVEIAWSKKGRFPELGGRPNHLDERPEAVDEYSVRLPYLVNKTDEFWCVPKKKFGDPVQEIIFNMQKPTDEEAVNALTPLVDDCIEKIIKYGIPHIKEFLG